MFNISNNINIFQGTLRPTLRQLEDLDGSFQYAFIFYPELTDDDFLHEHHLNHLVEDIQEHLDFWRNELEGSNNRELPRQ